MVDRNKQSMKGMDLKGDASQSSDQPNTSMSMHDVSARNASQQQAVDAPTIELFGWKGRGKWAVFAVAIVALAALLAKVLLD